MWRNSSLKVGPTIIGDTPASAYIQNSAMNMMMCTLLVVSCCCVLAIRMRRGDHDYLGHDYQDFHGQHVESPTEVTP